MNKVIEAVGVSKIYGLLPKTNQTGNPVGDTMQVVIHSKIQKPVTIALDAVDLSVYEGDFVCIMGPSGSGKTTLLNVLSTIDRPSKGMVRIQGENIRKMGDIALGNFRNKYLGFIFQQFNLLENLSIFDNVAMPLSIANLTDEEIIVRVQDIAKKVGIESLLDKFPNECSGGQCQRCAVARALVSNPKLIVADEPTGNLDSKNTHEILQLLRKLNREDGVTILLVTHDSMIASYADQLLFLMDGKIDTILTKENDTQKAFYYRIMEVTSQEAMALLEE